MSELCSQCHQREAVVRLTQVQDDQVQTLRLCERCAAERGVDTGVGLGATPLGGFLAALGHVGPALGPAGVDDVEVCPGCGATAEDFRATGRVGCATCWEAFAGSLGPLLRRLHGSTHHTGTRYLPPGRSAPDRAGEVRRLAEQLELAVATENFELAAELRDRLREAQS
jgi:protein arginine kinase activator